MADFKWTEQPICPYCEHVERDAWEIEFPPGIECVVTCCNSCGKDFTVCERVTVNYSTYELTPDAPGAASDKPTPAEPLFPSSATDGKE